MGAAKGLKAAARHAGVLMKIAERVRSRQNNFDALRLIAASLVLVSHCFPLTGRSDPFGAISGQTLGELGVSIFFAISGFLIAKSWSDSRAVAPFALKRGLRLLPALVIAVLLTALVLGPLVTTLSPLRYFTSAEVYRYIAENSALFTINGRLPGVFVHNVYPSAVNGSLWTLPVEATAYVAAAILGAVGALRGRVGLACVSFLALLALSTPMAGVSSLQLGGAAGGDLADVVYLGGLFNCGMLLYALCDRIALRWDVFVLFTIAWIASYDTVWVRPVAIVVIPYLVLVLAYRTPAAVRVITRPGDVSYGIYVYAFPTQQLAAFVWGPGLTPGIMLGLVAAPVYLLALASWRLVEAPALGLKQRFLTKSDSIRPLPERFRRITSPLTNAGEPRPLD